MSQYVIHYRRGNTLRSATIHADSEAKALAQFSHRFGLSITGHIHSKSISKRPTTTRRTPSSIKKKEPYSPASSPTDSSLVAEIIPGFPLSH